MSYQHAVVWLDHREAKVIDFSVDDQHTHVIVNEHEPRQVHRKEGEINGDAHLGEFYENVFAAIGGAREVLLVGPAQAKLELRKHIETKHPQHAERIVGVEGMDHPTSGELLKHARAYFKKYDQVH